jgi:uncharacterized protein
MEILLAIISGSLFGFVLQRVGAADPDKIIGMLRLTDLHLVKTILTGIGVSSSVLFIGMFAGLIDSSHLSVKAMYPGVLAGGAILGFGWALSGFCPGTGVVAAGSGRIDALLFIVGGLFGAGLFTLMYGSLAEMGLFNSILGGEVTLAGTEKYDAVFSGINGAILATIIGLILIVVAFRLPRSIR